MALAQDSLQNITVVQTSHDWIFYVFVFVFLLLGIARVFYSRSFLDGFKSFKNINVAHQNFKTQNLKLFFVDISLTFVFILMFSLLMFIQLNARYSWSTDFAFSWYVVICLLLIVGLGLKLFANKILTEILPFKETLNFSNYIFWLSIKMMGLVLIPVALFAIYNPFIPIQSSVLFVLLGALAIFYLIYVMRLFKIGKDYVYKSNLHFFLYICAFEIAPIFVILKFSILIINKLQQVFI